MKRALSGDLDWIVMKALEKDRTRRYETANGFAADILRHLSSEPVLAAPPSRAYRLRKFVRKHRGGVIAASLVLLALLAGIAGTTWGWYAARRSARAERLARLDAQNQQARAEERETQAIDAVKRFRDAVAGEPALKNNAELEALRKRLLKEPLAFFKNLRDRLEADKDTRPESLNRLARASFELGTLTGEIGDKRDALIAHQEALAIFEKLADANPTVTEFQSRLAANQDSIGRLLYDTGKPAEALKAHGSALAIRQRLADENPSDTEFQRSLALSHHNIGILLRNARKLAEAMKAHERALAIYQKLADGNPTVADFRNCLAASQNDIGVLLRDAGKRAEAMKAIESALAIRWKLADANPTVTEFQNSLAASHLNIGSLLSTAGNRAEALKSYERALAILQKLADANPTVTEFQIKLAMNYNEIGHVLSATGQFAEALKSYESALAIRRKLAREHPELPDLASELGGSLHNVASFEMDTKRFQEARVRLREAVVWQRKALAANPAHPKFRKFLDNHLRLLQTVAQYLSDSEGIAEAQRELTKFRDSDPAMLALDTRLVAVIKGVEQPRDEADRLALAELAYDKALHATAARLWAEAIAANPKLGDDRTAQHRYNAACATALAGCGHGKDNPTPDEAAKAKLRQQALEWLKAEHAAWSKLLESDAAKAGLFVAKTLAHWQKDTDLAGIRDEKDIAKLPESERSTVKQFWSDVDSLLTKARGGK